MGLMTTPAPAGPAIQHPVPPPLPRVAGAGTRGALELVLGTALPATALLIEMATGMSADAYLDPLPDWRALLLAWTVPAANFAGWWGRGAIPVRVRTYLSALALGIASVYATLFLPIAPFAILAVLALGIGLLPLSPLGAVYASIRQFRDCVAEPGAPSPVRALGFSAAVIVLAASPAIWTHLLLDRALKTSPAEQGSAVEWLRVIGDRGYIRDAGDDNRPAGWLGRRPDPARIRNIYYLVTGDPHTSRARTRRSWLSSVTGLNTGGDQPGQPLPGLSLASSRIEGRITPRAALQHQEWTLEFRNTDEFQQREARAVIVLPEGGVVSRVTLWIDGEEREAAFGGRAQTKAAYRSVVTVRRDPLLVQTAGPGRVLAQCFPVPPRGSMKIRLGISAPVRDGVVELPYFGDRNFAADDVNHSVWIDGGAVPFSRSLPGSALRQPLSIRVADAAGTSWTPHPLDKSRVIVQKIVPAVVPERLEVVMDGSKSMADLAEPVEAAFSRAAKRHPGWRLTVTGNYRGGTDNVAALRSAQDRLAAAGGGTILWLHGPQPVEITSAETLRGHFERAANRVELAAAQLIPGPDVVTPRLDGLAAVRSIRVTAADWVDRLEWSPAFSRESLPAAGHPDGFEAPADLARLWASGEVVRLMSLGRGAAERLGADLRLVTPATGAVVLENRSQYSAFGLDPGKGLTNVPEPGTMILVGGALGVLWICRKRKHNATS